MMDTIAIHRLAGAPSAAEVRRTHSRPTDAMPGSPDCELAQRFATGELAAIEQVVADHQPDVTRLVQRMLAWQPDTTVDDLVQDVFVRAIESRHSFNGRASLRTWLMQIAINECRAHFRKQKRRQRLLRWWHAGRTSAVAPDASCRAEDDETAHAVRQAVAQLSPTYREVVVLVYLQQMSMQQVADVLGIKLGTAHTRLSRAREKLRTLLDPALVQD